MKRLLSLRELLLVLGRMTPILALSCELGGNAGFYWWMYYK